jgi:PPK2 family polyphosphate:nucleotide phosphotransferase
MNSKLFLPTTFAAGKKIKLADIDTASPAEGITKDEAVARIRANAEEMADLAKSLYVENRQALLLVLQGMDTAGKDGTIRNITKGVNPRSCVVTSFKRPSEEELDHDFLWRVHQAVPRKGDIGIFNRSHYEDVLIVRVNELVPKKIWKDRYEQINNFEKLLTESGTTIVKCYLHISSEQQRKRLQDRIDKPSLQWKFNPADLDVRKQWDAYQDAYEEALFRCNTKEAPWYIIPADRRWYRNLVVSELVKKTLKKMDPQLPGAQADLKGIIVE